MSGAGQITGGGGFTPATSIKEAEKRLYEFTKPATLDPLVKFHGEELYAQGVFLDGLPLKKLNSILAAAEDTLGKYNVKVNQIGFTKANKRHWGKFTDLNGNDSRIGLQKTITKGMDKKQKDIVKFYSDQRTKKIADTKKMIEKLKDKPYAVKGFQDRLEWLERTPSFNVMTRNADIDGVYAVMKHESYHGVYFKYGLEKPFIKNIQKHGVEKWSSVSEYAGTNAQEFFAELATAVDLKLPVPSNFKKAFIDTIGEIEK